MKVRFVRKLNVNSSKYSRDEVYVRKEYDSYGDFTIFYVTLPGDVNERTLNYFVKNLEGAPELSKFDIIPSSEQRDENIPSSLYDFTIERDGKSTMSEKTVTSIVKKYVKRVL